MPTKTARAQQYRGRHGEFTVYGARQQDADRMVEWDDIDHPVSIPAGRGVCLFLRRGKREVAISLEHPSIEMAASVAKTMVYAHYRDLETDEDRATIRRLGQEGTTETDLATVWALVDRAERTRHDWERQVTPLIEDALAALGD